MTIRRTAAMLSGAAVAALALGACALQRAEVEVYDDEPYGGTQVVVEQSYPQRVYYREPNDTVNVYYYESSRPDVVIDRRVHRERSGRTFYVERDRGVDRRYYFDDRAAHSRWSGKGRDSGKGQKGKDHDKGRGNDGDRVHDQRNDHGRR